MRRTLRLAAVAAVLLFSLAPVASAAAPPSGTLFGPNQAGPCLSGGFPIGDFAGRVVVREARFTNVARSLPTTLTLQVKVRRLAPQTTYEVGVSRLNAFNRFTDETYCDPRASGILGTLTTNRGGNGNAILRASFRDQIRPVSVKDVLYSVLVWPQGADPADVHFATEQIAVPVTECCADPGPY